MKPKWVRVQGGYKSIRYMNSWRHECPDGHRTDTSWKYSDDQSTIICGAPLPDGGRCQRRFWVMEMPAPPAPSQPKVATTQDEAIQRRLAAAHKLYEKAVDDAQRAMARVAAHRQRIRRLQAALKVSAHERRARARKALTTRSQAGKRRGIDLKGV